MCLLLACVVCSCCWLHVAVVCYGSLCTVDVCSLLLFVGVCRYLLLLSSFIIVSSLSLCIVMPWWVMLFVEACGCFCCCYCCVSLCASVLQMDVCSLSLLLFVVSYCTVSRWFLCPLVILVCCCFLFGVCRKVIFFTVDICCWLFGCSLVVAVIWWCLLLEGNSDNTRPFASWGETIHGTQNDGAKWNT